MKRFNNRVSQVSTIFLKDKMSIESLVIKQAVMNSSSINIRQ